MENKLVSGDYVPDGAGGILRQHGKEALLSRALFCLTCRRGAFPFLPELGSRLWQLKEQKPASMAANAMSYAAEAVAPLGLTVTGVQITPMENRCIHLDVQLALQGDTAVLEVTL